MGLKTLWLKIKGDDKGLKKSLKSSEENVNKFGKTVKKLGGLIAGAFALRQLLRFGAEILNIAARAEGIERAFKKLDDPNLLNDLKRATRGTVDDLTLMQKAVQAKNFKIPLEQLSTYFKFATNRSIETGESVDYLVNSIITGIGRKSVLVMDNLGISAAELQDEVKRVGDFGAAAGIIIQRELEKAGDVADTMAIKIQAVATSWQNAKRSLGEYLAQSENLRKNLDEWAMFFDVMSSEQFTFWEKLIAVISDKKVVQLAKELALSTSTMQESTFTLYGSADRAGGAVDILLKALESFHTVKKPVEETLNTLNDKLSDLGEILKNTNIQDRERIKNLYSEIRATEALIKTIEDLKIVRKAMPGGAAKLPGKTELPSMAPAGIDTSALKDMGIAVNQYANDIWGLVDAIVALGSEASPALQEFANQMLAWQNMIFNVEEAIVSLAQNIAETLGEAIGKALAQGGFEDLGKNLLMNFADFLSQLGGLMVAYGVAVEAFSLLSKSPDPISAGLAIAAGLAAIAIAGVIKGAIAGSAKSLGGGGSSYGGSYAGATKSNNIQAYTSMIQVEGILKGSDIVIASKRYIDKRNIIT